MAACTFNRLDSRNTATSKVKYGSRLIVDPDTNEIMVAWIDSGVGGGSPQPQSVRFARFDTTTLTPNSEVPIKSDYTFLSTTRGPDMVRLDDGRLICVWYSDNSVAPGNNVCSASESADGGATWSAAVNITTTNAQGWSLCTDGTTVWLISNVISSGGGFGAGDVVSFKRTGVDTWAAGINVYNSGGVGGTPGAWDTTQPEQYHLAAVMGSALVGLAVGCRFPDGSSAAVNVLACLYTTDGWATATRVTIDTFTATGSANALNLLDVNGRVWLQTHDPDASDKIILYYTDDYGQTWTSAGTPDVYSAWLTANGVSGDASYDAWLCVDELDNLILGQSTQQILSPSGLHAAFRSPNDPTDMAGWVQVGECTYNTTQNTVITATAGRGVIIGGTLYRLLASQRDSGGTPWYTLEFLAVEDAGEEPEPPPPAPTPVSESGSDDNNMLYRIDLQEGRGWSLHTHAVSCFLGWDEGDEATGTEIPILLTGSPSIDPQILQPDLLPALWRIETGQDEGYGKRVYVAPSSDAVAVRTDPLRMIVTSKQFTINKAFERNVVRGALVTYTFDAPVGSVVPMQVWVDGGKLNRVIELTPTAGERVSRFFPLPTFANVGEIIQFVIDEESVYPLSVDAIGYKFIPKKIRG